ncbi:macro domain-containing protein [Streptomyces sp. NPDC059373]
MSPATRHRLRTLYGTRHGLSALARDCAVQFGLLSGIAQLYLTFWPDSSLPRGTTLVVITGLVLVGGTLRAWPRNSISREFHNPGFAVSVEVGDLFDQPSHLVIGCNDVFDTDTQDDLLIVRRSVQGQFLHRVYGGDVPRLNAELTAALAGTVPVGVEEPSAKRAGKLARYPIGTVAVIGAPERRYFLPAYSTMQNDLTVSSGVDQLWRGLGELWAAVHLYGRREALAMPILGSDLARVDSMDHGGLIKLILLSFVARSREAIVCNHLTIVVHPKDYCRIDMLELAAFLRTL